MNLHPIKVAVLHRHPVANAGLAVGLRRYGDFELVEPTAHAARDAPAPDIRHKADVVITDCDEGIAFIEQCRALGLPSPPRVMIVSPSDREADIRRALASGARGYMLLESDFDALAHAVRNIHVGMRALSTRIAQQLAESVSSEQLTPREQEVLRLVVAGHGNKIIARRLDVAIGTVKSHLKSVFNKLGVESRTQAIRVALRRGIVAEPTGDS